MEPQAIDLEVRRKAEKVRLLLMDVDGVLTDGLLFYVPSDATGMFETKGFNSQDGLGFHFCNSAGIKTGVISGRDSAALAHRAKLLKMSYVYQGLLKKQGAYAEILKDADVVDEAVAYIGDDLTDLPLIQRAGFGVAVANARPEVKAAADYITTARGGEGAVREVIELILKAQGRWEEALAAFEIES